MAVTAHGGAVHPSWFDVVKLPVDENEPQPRGRPRVRPSKASAVQGEEEENRLELERHESTLAASVQGEEEKRLARVEATLAASVLSIHRVLDQFVAEGVHTREIVLGGDLGKGGGVGGREGVQTHLALPLA